jgi:hypothetical protein
VLPPVVLAVPVGTVVLPVLVGSLPVVPTPEVEAALSCG